MLTLSENINSIAQAWATIQMEATAMAQREPFLTPFLKQSNHESQKIKNAFTRQHKHRRYQFLGVPREVKAS